MRRVSKTGSRRPIMYSKCCEPGPHVLLLALETLESQQYLGEALSGVQDVASSGAEAKTLVFAKRASTSGKGVPRWFWIRQPPVCGQAFPACSRRIPTLLRGKPSGVRFTAPVFGGNILVASSCSPAAVGVPNDRCF